MSKYYITIGRQPGCGGRLVGKDLADRLGIAYYDKDNIIALVAED
ncbi:MAG: cytidylate kinase family protein, partial [Clostridia bacterium]|nr:cytidylate kinase family protein [Clostridia bacterium]